jgi:methylated-DNA-[protein]-cysteine S-methyltransferase
MSFICYHSPIGLLHIESHNGTQLCGIRFVHGDEPVAPAPYEFYPLLREAQQQLDAYFTGRLKTFDLPLYMNDTPFTMSVWRELQAIPYAVTISYSELAQRIGVPKAVRAVGHANEKNPFIIVVPCHRVIGAKGQLTGYRAGLTRKEWLLDHEMKIAGIQTDPELF